MTDNRVTLYEVGPRDGLQNEAQEIPTASKIALVDLLTRVGFSHIEVTSFVSPKWVPQMADAVLVMAGIKRRDNVRYAVLTPNMIGFEKAMEAKANEVAVFAAASEGFSQKNINCSIAESIKRFQPILEAAERLRIPVRAYVSCVIACPYDGETKPEKGFGSGRDFACYGLLRSFPWRYHRGWNAGQHCEIVGMRHQDYPCC